MVSHTLCIAKLSATTEVINSERIYIDKRAFIFGRTSEVRHRFVRLRDLSGMLIFTSSAMVVAKAKRVSVERPVGRGAPAGRRFPRQGAIPRLGRKSGRYRRRPHSFDSPSRQPCTLRTKEGKSRRL